MTETAKYLYAVTRGPAAGPVTDGRGLGGAPLQVVEHDGLCAVVSEVDLAEFGEEPLRRHLEDLGWLEEVARGHDRVVQHVAALGPTAPLRLATICLDDAAVRARLQEWHDPLTAALDRVEGRSEWSVKVYSRPADASAEQGTDEQPAAGRASGAGAAYLQRKRARSTQRLAAEERAVEVARAVHRELAEHAVASRLLQPQDPRLTGHVGTNVLNAAYLVPDDDGTRFSGAAAGLAAEHPEFEVTVLGPWPPYSFATLEQG